MAALTPLGAARATPVDFNVNGARSRTVICTPGNELGETARLFLGGTMTVDLSDEAPVPLVGTSPLSIANIKGLLTGSDLRNLAGELKKGTRSASKARLTQSFSI